MSPKGEIHEIRSIATTVRSYLSLFPDVRHAIRKLFAIRLVRRDRTNISQVVREKISGEREFFHDLWGEYFHDLWGASYASKMKGRFLPLPLIKIWHGR